jgi:D-alanyl-D-alanine carboxypeptidase (penicillin-binding protein 5/6)
MASGAGARLWSGLLLALAVVGAAASPAILRDAGRLTDSAYHSTVAPARHPLPVGGVLLGRRGVVVHPLRGAPALPRHLTAGGWLVADLDTGQVLAARDAHGRFLPASTLKILTALVLIPRLHPASRVVATEADAGIDGSKVGLAPHTAYRVSTLFTALLVVSANDAANALARAAGGVPRTLALMNAAARRLNADDTHAGTPSGLDARGESTSAYDLALITRAALRLAAFRHYISIRLAWINAPHGRYQMYTHDLLLLNYRGAFGVKNGYTSHAGGTYVGAATRHGHTLVVTALHGPPLVWPQVAALLDWGFAVDGRIRPVGTLVPPGQRRLPAPGRVAATAGSGRRVPALSFPELPVAVTIAAGLGATVLGYRGRRRARRRSARRRYALPPI